MFVIVPIFGTHNITKAALISSIVPLVAKKNDNPNGVPQKDLEDIFNALQSNSVGFLKGFHKNFYNYKNDSKTVSEAQLNFY